ncbi:MAG TPA: tyrosine-type recombinase/integrase [Candidatus Sulfotelmatobacter sp.]|nr:tyrosine-type recombinase/integrase [Candidatus Sulfotelmatobacter sp.]
MHPDGGGLYLQITGENARSWIFRFVSPLRRPEKPDAPWERQMGLGPVNDVSLADARVEAAKCRNLLREHLDPIEARAERRRATRAEAAKSVTFDWCAEQLINDRKAGWRNRKHAGQWKATLETYAGPVLGKLPVGAIDTGLVMKVLRPIWTTKPETAGRVRGRIETVLSWATVHGYRQGDNPARWRGHIDQLLPRRSKIQKVKHHAALPYTEIGAFMSDVRAKEGIAARALELLILTAARSGEIRNAPWSEFDLTKKLWVIPAARMKAGREHRVPLSSTAVALLEKLKAERDESIDLVFPTSSGDPLSDAAMKSLLKRMGYGDFTVHGFRSAFQDWRAEVTHFSRDLGEAALAHTIGDQTVEAYERTDFLEKRRPMMEAWARYCDTVRNGDNVASIAAVTPSKGDMGRRIAFLDCEASSLDEQKSYPIEIGWCFADADDVESHLIIPYPDWLDWDPQSQKLHGLDRKTLFAQGEPGPPVARRLIEALGGADVYADSEKDRVWIEKLCATAGVAATVIVGRFEALLYDVVPGDLGDVSRMELIQEGRRLADQLAPRAHRAGPDACHLRAWYRMTLRLVSFET